MFRRSLSAASFCLWLAAAAAAPSQHATGHPPPALADALERLEQAYRGGDAAALASAGLQLQATASVADAPRAGYYAAYARFRQALAAPDPGRAGAHVDQCIDGLGAYVARQPADAEARALLGSCYGLSTRHHRLGVATRGLEARRQMAAAREIAPDNPWVVMQDGLADFATPRLFGGDRALAIRKLERAAALFLAATADGSRLAAWGAAEAWEQLAVMYRGTGRLADADRALERARELAARTAVAAGHPIGPEHVATAPDRDQRKGENS